MGKLYKAAIALLFFLYQSAAIAQPNIQWEKCMGDSVYDLASTIVQTKDSGYVVVGYNSCNSWDVTGNHGAYDCWVVKLNDTGSIQWQKSLGGSQNDFGWSIQQTFDGGYIVAGVTKSPDGDVTGYHGGVGFDYWVVKLSGTGSIQWEKCYGGSDDDNAGSIIQTKDSGYIIAGYTYSTDGDVTGNHGTYDCWIVKISDTGAIQWQKCYGGSNNDYAYNILQTPDGGYIFSGNSNSIDGNVTGLHGDYDYWVVKINDTGAIQWEKTYGGNGAETYSEIKQTNYGGYIVSGSSNTVNNGDVTGNRGGIDYWIVKISDTGAIQWERSYGGSGNDYACAIHQTSDSGYVVDGYSNSVDGDITNNFGDYDYWEVKISASGSIQWQTSLGGSSSDLDQCMIQTLDGGYIAAGVSSSVDNDVTGNHGQGNFWIVKLYPDTINTGVATLPASKQTLQIWPSPNNGTFTIFLPAPTTESLQVTITDIIGQTIKETTATTNKNIPMLLDAPPGMYFVTALTSMGKQTAKVVVK